MQNCRLINLVYSTARRCVNGHQAIARIPFVGNSPQSVYSLNALSQRFCFSTTAFLKSQGVRKNFSEFVTDHGILKELQKNGITSMFPIQQETFKVIQQGKDILASDRTGSGKTLGYTLPVLQKFNKANYHLKEIKTPKFLILCPTRQLVMQVSEEIRKIHSVYKVVSVYGGTPIDRQINEINRGVSIVVATPGRLIDLLKRKALNLADLEVVCIDEADTMLEKGFKEDVEQIFQFVRSAAGKTQNIMFSATIPMWVNKIAQQYFDKNMKRVNMVKDQDVKTSQTVEHYAIYAKRQQRYDVVKSLIEKYNPSNRTIIFTQKKVEADDFMYQLKNNNIVILHGDIPQRKREQNIYNFRKGSKKILIATDIAARGIDIPDVELIIQLSPPQNSEQYIHRSGRTGRAGKEGINITIFDQSNVSQLLQAENSANIKIKLIDDSQNLWFWSKKLAKINASNLVDQAQKKFVQDIILKAKAKQEFLQNISLLSNQKGFVSFIAYSKGQKSVLLSSALNGINLHNQITDNEGIKFDVPVADYSKLYQAINKQNSFYIQELTQYSNKTLSMFAKKIMKGQSSRRQNNRDYNNSSSRQSRYDGQRQSRYEQRERNNSPRKNNYENREQRQNKPQKKSVSDLPEGLRSYKLFLYGFSPEVNEASFKEQIKSQAGLSDYRLKIINKVDTEGNAKTFGFIQFSSKQDCQTFMDSTINLNGDLLKKRIAQDRK